MRVFEREPGHDPAPTICPPLPTPDQWVKLSVGMVPGECGATREEENEFLSSRPEGVPGSGSQDTDPSGGISW